MLFRVINNILTSSLVYGFLMLMTTTALADSEDFQFSRQLVAEQSNPWALPQVKEKKPGYRGGYNQNNQADSNHGQYSDTPYQGRQYQNRNGAGQSQRNNYWQPRVDRFVTPEFLESLKQQQKMQQIMPENRQNREYEYGPQGSMQRSPEARLPGLNGSGYSMYGPSYGKGSVNPLYDTPAASPWGGGADVLYQGESFPLVPSEAIGGFAPMHVPSFGIQRYPDNYFNETNETDVERIKKPKENNVFNPFTFLPDAGL